MRDRCCSGIPAACLVAVVAPLLIAFPSHGEQEADLGEQAAERLRQLDANADGKLEPDEIGWPAVFRRIDRDRDGTITLSEMQAFVEAQATGRRSTESDQVRPPTSNRHFERRQFTGEDGRELTYYLMKPEDYDPDQAYPLVLTLHGRQGRTYAAEVLGRDDMRGQFPCFALAPAAPAQCTWAVPGKLRIPRPRPEIMSLVFEAVDAVLEEFSVDRGRVYVTGQSMGGLGTFGALFARPRFFAAAAPVCGGWDPADAHQIAHVPMWVFHAEADPTVPVAASRDMVAALREAGGQPEYTEYEGVGHNSWLKAYEEPGLWEWVFAQRAVPAEGQTPP